MKNSWQLRPCLQSKQKPQSKQPWVKIPQLLSALVLGWSVGVAPVLAGDPFRTDNPAEIGEVEEEAFNAVFVTGDYGAAAELLAEAEADESREPMVYALLASLAYLDENWADLDAYATQTREIAEELTEENPLRGHLYTAIGHFLEGAYVLSAGEGGGVITALNRLQQVYRELDQAKAINPDDPELNLIEGYMNMLIAVNLPLSSPEEAITQLEEHAQPLFLAKWGIAVARRDQRRFEEALDYVNQALDEAENHPQLYYLRAQIQREYGQNTEDEARLNQAQSDFRRALAKSSQLPKSLVSQIFREYCRNQNQIDQQERDCGALREPIQATDDRWGPETVPELG
jgi:tetratricopeptide (TPR) repeat protein